MKKLNFNTDFKLKISIVIISLLLLISILSFNFSKDNFYVISTIIGLLCFVIITISVIGLIRSIKTLDKRITFKKIVFFVFIGSFVGFFIYLIISNTIDAIKSL